MRLFALATSLLIGSVMPAFAQASHQGDAALTYQWVHTNTQPGACGCFGLNGGGVSASWDVFHRWSAVADISGGYEGNEPSTGNSLTLVSYMAGARYTFRQLWSPSPHALHPFAQVLVGAAHAGGGIAGAGDGTYAFATRAGAGLDLPINASFAVRLIQVDYYSTDFANTTNNHQNNLLLGAGVVVRWTRK